VFDGLDAVLMFHPGHEWRTFTESLACQSVEVVFGGKASHAVAAPEAGVNALEAMIDLFVAAREIRAASKDVRLPGVLLEGGLRANIVPDRAVARFSARARTSEERDRVLDALLAAVARIAGATGCRSLVRPVDNPYDEMSTSGALAAVLREELAARGGTTNDAPRKGMGSIDAGNVSRRAPTVHAYLPAAPSGVPLHTREFGERASGTLCEGALRTASGAMAATALRLARDGALRDAVRSEFEAAGRPLRPARWPLLRGEPEPRVEC
jgi:metal-dependent amidase/aminoacylase/carboxypeptidase family protein